MGLFSKKPKIRFETIFIEQEKDIFRALEAKGFALCTDPFQFDVHKSHEKLRKDAMKMGKELHAELIVEIWDPIYQKMHWKGLKYSAWRKATPEELIARKKKDSIRPDYSDSFGSYDEIARKLDEKKLKVDTQDVQTFNEVVSTDDITLEGETYGSSEDDPGMIVEKFDTVSTFNPYDHQGESQRDIRKDHIDTEAASQGPQFDSSFKMEIGAPEIRDPTEEIDPLAMMMEAADAQPEAQAPSPASAPAQPPVGLSQAPSQLPQTPPPAPPAAQVKKDENPETAEGQ